MSELEADTSESNGLNLEAESVHRNEMQNIAAEEISEIEEITEGIVELAAEELQERVAFVEYLEEPNEKKDEEGNSEENERIGNIFLENMSTDPFQIWEQSINNNRNKNKNGQKINISNESLPIVDLENNVNQTAEQKATKKPDSSGAFCHPDGDESFYNQQNNQVSYGLPTDLPEEDGSSKFPKKRKLTSYFSKVRCGNSKLKGGDVSSDSEKAYDVTDSEISDGLLDDCLKGESSSNNQKRRKKRNARQSGGKLKTPQIVSEQFSMEPEARSYRQLPTLGIPKNMSLEERNSLRLWQAQHRQMVEENYRMFEKKKRARKRTKKNKNKESGSNSSSSSESFTPRQKQAKKEPTYYKTSSDDDDQDDKPMHGVNEINILTV